LKINTNQRINNLIFASLILFFLLATGFGAVNAKFKENDQIIKLLLEQINPKHKEIIMKMTYLELTDKIEQTKKDLKLAKTEELKQVIEIELLMLEEIMDDTISKGRQ
jgi:hypothetical protein